MLSKCLLAFCPEITWKSPWLWNDTFYVMKQILYSWTVWGKLTGRGTHPGYVQTLKNCMLKSALESGCPFSFLCWKLMNIHICKSQQPFSSRKGTEQIAEGFYITRETIYQHQKFSVDQKILVTGDITRTLRKAEHEWDINCSSSALVWTAALPGTGRWVPAPAQ